jgi:hypothetical protein
MTIGYQIDREEFYKIYEICSSSIDYKTPDDEYRKCRYCNTVDSKKFKSKAHLIPEFTGNKEVFCYNECDDCNNKFGLYETHLSAFSGIKNSFLPIKGKKQYPKFKDTKNGFTNQFLGDNQVSLKVEGSSEFIKHENGFINIESVTQSFIPLYVFKSLVKFAISIVKKEDLSKLTKTIEWINNPKSQSENFITLLLIHNESRPPLIKPLAILMKRKDEYLNNDVPEFSFIFSFGFHRLQIFLPYNVSDEELNKENIILPLNFDFVLQKERGKGYWSFGHMDMNWLKKVKLKDNFKAKFTPHSGNFDS